MPEGQIRLGDMLYLSYKLLQYITEFMYFCVVLLIAAVLPPKKPLSLNMQKRFNRAHKALQKPNLFNKYF